MVVRAEWPLLAAAKLPTCVLAFSVEPTGAIHEIRFMPPDTPIPAPPSTHPFIEQLSRYIENPRQGFEVFLAPRGTTFQNRVWECIRNIKCGDTRTYGSLSSELQSSARAVGQACGANPFPIVVPCHRVLARTGAGGFAHQRAGWLMETKLWLLQHEGYI